MKIFQLLIILIFTNILNANERNYYYNYLEDNNKMSFQEFKKITDFNKNEIEQCIQNSITRHNIPKEIFYSILNVENNEKYPYAINCNNNIKPYTSSTYKNYMNYLTCSDNVDVGLMQINYITWKEKYPRVTFDKLLNPCINTEMAARILKSHYNETKDWMKAAGYYHSRTPKHFKKYSKLLKREMAKIKTKKTTSNMDYLFY